MIFETSVKAHQVTEQKKSALSTNENMIMGMDISISMSYLRNCK